jgi:tetratricopeptide (TPR) repeat protein
MIGSVWNTCFKRQESYSRAEKLERAARARGRGRKGRAIAEYKKVLSLDPGDLDVHSRIAPLLAGKKLFDEAWASFETAADGFYARGFTTRAMGVYRQAARAIPGNTAPWEAVVRLQMEKGLKPDAINTLIEASTRFKGRKQRAGRIKLLRLAFDLAPWRHDVTYDLAATLVRGGCRKEALELFTGLADRLTGRELSRVRGTMLRRFPTPGAAWRWLRAAFFSR